MYKWLIVYYDNYAKTINNTIYTCATKSEAYNMFIKVHDTNQNPVINMIKL